jgi:plastocyanin
MKKGQGGFGTVGWIISAVVVVAVAAVGWYVWQQNKDDTKSTSTKTQITEAPKQSQNTSTQFSFATPKKGAHFETSTPTHATTLAAAPVEVVINFNFDLHSKSTLKVTKDGKDYSVGSTTVDANKLTMRRKMATSVPDGVYTVTYDGCWPDGSCHDGHFQFAVDSKKLSSYTDMKNQKEVTVKLSQVKFMPMDLIVSSGTKITWVNDDSETHYINTDSHPAHTQVLGFNSKALQKGDSFSYTFTDKGAYPYHCSAHAANMTGNIVVI